MRTHGGRDRGGATAEFAVVLPAIVAVLATIAGAGGYGIAVLRAETAATQGARDLARSESPAVAQASVRRIAGADADVTVARSGGWVTVTVTRRLPAVYGVIGRSDVTGAATIRDEKAAS